MTNAKIVNIKGSDGVIQYPITKPEAVIDDRGKNILEIIQENGSSEGGSDDMYVISDFTIEQILYADEGIECNVSDITSAIDANKQIYIRFADYAPGLTPCNVYHEDFYYISFVYDEMLCRLEIVPGNNYVGILKKLNLALVVSQSDWSTSDENDPAYIKNRTHYKDVEILEDGGLKTNNDGEPISPNYIRFRNEYGNLSDLIIVNDYTDGSYIDGAPLYDEYGDPAEYIYGTLLFQPDNWTIRFTPEGDGIYYVDSVYGSLKQLDEEFIPDTIARKSELTELSTEVGKKQATIEDLDSIRSGAGKGATAVQPSTLANYATTEFVNNAIQTAIINELNSDF